MSNDALAVHDACGTNGDPNPLSTQEYSRVLRRLMKKRASSCLFDMVVVGVVGCSDRVGDTFNVKAPKRFSSRWLPKTEGRQGRLQKSLTDMHRQNPYKAEAAETTHGMAPSTKCAERAEKMGNGRTSES